VGCWDDENPGSPSCLSPHKVIALAQHTRRPQKSTWAESCSRCTFESPIVGFNQQKQGVFTKERWGLLTNKIVIVKKFYPIKKM